MKHLSMVIVLILFLFILLASGARGSGAEAGAPAETGAAAEAYLRGYAAGIEHVIASGDWWTVDRYDPDNPESSAWNGYDQRIFLTIDGVTYTLGMLQG